MIAEGENKEIGNHGKWFWTARDELLIQKKNLD